MKNILKSKITPWISIALFFINIFFLFGYSHIGFGYDVYMFAFFRVSKSFYDTYAGIFWPLHLLLVLASLTVFIISLVYYFKVHYKKK